MVCRRPLAESYLYFSDFNMTLWRHGEKFSGLRARDDVRFFWSGNPRIFNADRVLVYICTV